MTPAAAMSQVSDQYPPITLDNDELAAMPNAGLTETQSPQR